MSKQRDQVELLPLPEWAPPIDEARREELRRDPRVTYRENRDPNRKWTFEPLMAVVEPIDVSELIDGDEDDDYQGM